METAGVSPLAVLGEVEFEVCVLTKKLGRLRWRAQVVASLQGVDGYMPMREINTMGANILTADKRIELAAFSPPIVLPLYEITDQQLPPAAGVTTPTAVAACLNATVQGSCLIEPHSASAGTFKIDEKFVLLRDIVLESDDARFVSIVADRHKVVIDGGFVPSVVNETGGPIELE